MAPRAFWTGNLRLSLVNIPVRLYPATSTERKIELHQIHEPSGKRIRYQKVAPGVGAVENEDIIKGYEYEKGKYVLLDQKEIDDLKLESKQTIELVRFVEPSAIDARYFEKPYYLLPDGDAAEEGYAIMLKALNQADKIGVGNFILRGQSNIVALKPCGKGLLLEILRHADEVEAGRHLLRGSARREGRQGSARARRRADRAEVRRVRAGEVQGRIYRGRVGADQRQDRAPRADGRDRRGPAPPRSSTSWTRSRRA